MHMHVSEFTHTDLMQHVIFLSVQTMMWMFDDNDFLQLEPVTSDNASQSQQLLVLLALDGYCRVGFCTQIKHEQSVSAITGSGTQGPTCYICVLQ